VPGNLLSRGEGYQGPCTRGRRPRKQLTLTLEHLERATYKRESVTPIVEGNEIRTEGRYLLCGKGNRLARVNKLTVYLTGRGKKAKNRREKFQVCHDAAQRGPSVGLKVYKHIRRGRKKVARADRDARSSPHLGWAATGGQRNRVNLGFIGGRKEARKKNTRRSCNRGGRTYDGRGNPNGEVRGE